MADGTKQQHAARAANEDVEARAIGAGRTVRNRRQAGEGDVPRADTRGVYRDLNGVRRTVGAGQVVPDGWERLEDADVDARAEGLATRGGAEGDAGEPSKSGTGGGAKK